MCMYKYGEYGETGIFLYPCMLMLSIMCDKEFCVLMCKTACHISYYIPVIRDMHPQLPKNNFNKVIEASFKVQESVLENRSHKDLKSLWLMHFNTLLCEPSYEDTDVLKLSDHNRGMSVFSIYLWKGGKHILYKKKTE